MRVVRERNDGIVLLRNFAHDGQPQAAAIGMVAEHAVEAFKDQTTFGGRDARAGILDIKQDLMGVVIDADAHGHAATGGRVVNGIVDEVPDCRQELSALTDNSGISRQDD